MFTVKRIKKFIEILLPIILLILIDQVIKIYIAEKLMQKNFYFVNNILGFKPYKNIEYSWLNSVFNLKIGLFTHIVVVIILLLATVVIYDFMASMKVISLLEKWLFMFLFAGILCSFLDKIFWGGSLDYIWLKHFFIFDLKDIYLSIFEIITLLCLIFNYKKIRNYNEKKLYADFKNYIQTRH
jgi:signal peptidase II